MASSWGFDLSSGLTALQQVGDRFSALKDELEQSIEETIRADRFGAPPPPPTGAQPRVCWGRLLGAALHFMHQCRQFSA